MHKKLVRIRSHTIEILERMSSACRSAALPPSRRHFIRFNLHALLTPSAWL
jgi:hypothetical protein